MTIKGNNLPKVKKQNTELIKMAIYRFAPITRGEIAHMLSLTLPTITTNVARLIQDGIVRELESSDACDSKNIGRPAVLIDYIEDSCFFIGIELGPYNTTACIVDIRGNVLQEVIMPVANSDYHLMLSELGGAVQNLITQSRIKKTAVLGIGLGIPGVVESEKGLLKNSARYSWANCFIAEDLQSITELPVHVENNVHARAIGEDLFNVDSRTDTFAYVLASKGIACSFIVKNNMSFSDVLGAGEIGHMVVQKDGPVCSTCGNHGCLEAIASVQAICDSCKKALDVGRAKKLEAICADASRPTIFEILQAQDLGDAAVSQILDEAITYLGIAIANVINFISPQMVLIDAAYMYSEQNQKKLFEKTRLNVFRLDGLALNMEFVPFVATRGAKGAAAAAIKRFLLRS